jgi:hypothetical protein
MTDFFGRLELELRSAAGRPRRLRDRLASSAPGGGVALIAVGAVLAAAVVPALLLTGGGDRGDAVKRPELRLPPAGTVIKKGRGNPPRQADSTVVATGRAPVAGPWQLEVYRGKGLKDPKSGEVYEPSGLRCLWIILRDPPDGPGPTAGGQCGEFPRTPGFGRVQHSVPTEGRRRDGSRIRVREVLVYGRVPARAAAVVITTAGGVRLKAKRYKGPKRARRDPQLIRGDFYLIPVKPGLGRARINWIDRNGRPGSRGIALLPPVSPLR